ncbi:hypothetical protein [Pseudoalteromonas sp. EB27]|uniref:hypothetical protein n=1 Tax=Pseudoalteromonas sp. EB27 TaxID=1938368 RepID=UPI00097742D1|nr:hypothetical protein [Pseudoalteromonas sp. EB27]
MPHYYLEGLNCEWSLVRESQTSSKFKVKLEECIYHLDVHYTSSASVTVNIVAIGDDVAIDKSVITELMEDLESVVLKHGNYGVIDYSMSVCPQVFEGNYSINQKKREIFNRDFHR